MKFLIKYLLILFVSFVSLLSFGQQLNVYNITNLSPVQNVAIFNLDHTVSVLSNENGVAEIGGFKPTDTLFFQHTGYFTQIIAIQKLVDLDYKVGMAARTIQLDQIVISASKWEQNREEIPNKIVVIPASEIAFENPQTSADILGLSNEVFIQKSQMGGGSPMIRGFSANSILLVNDGVRMNNAIYRSGNLQNVVMIDPNIVESSEVIFGPGSVIYGSDALGGVMDFHSRRVKLSSDNNTKISGNALARYSSANNERTGHVDFNFGKKNWGFLTSVSYSMFDDLRQGAVGLPEFDRTDYVERMNGQDSMVKNDNVNMQIQSAYNQVNVLQKFFVKLSDHVDIGYNFQYTTSTDIPRYDRLAEYNGDELAYAKWYYGPQKWMMNALRIDLHDYYNWFDNAKVQIAWQKAEESRNDRKFGKNDLRTRTENVDVFSLNADFDKSINSKTSLYYGAEGVYNKVNSSGESKDILTGDLSPVSTRYPDGGTNYSTVAAYASLKSNLSEKFTLQAGLRYSYVFMDSKFSDTSFYDFSYSEIKLSTGALNGSLGMVYRPEPKWQINANLSSGFRAPNLDDIAKVFDSEPGNVIVPNADLKPEYAYNIDAGFIKKFGENIELDFTVFYTYLIDAMVRRDFTFDGQDSIMYDGELSKVQALVNTGEAQIYGATASFFADINEHFSFKTTYTFMKGEDGDGYAVRHVPPSFGSSSLFYTARKLKLEAYANYNGQISYENLAPSEQDKPQMYATDENGNPYSPAWFTLNLKGSYQINEMFQVNLGFENILDKRYRPYSSGISAPGRNIILALRVKF
jgi:hemoglobin/transferrin/lactoferrin receptor protein